MSFQGDVAGIGLANLLQSLARGRVGVLTLQSREGFQATLGLHTGLLSLLPDPGEDSEIWRQRVRRAWVRDPNLSIDAIRMSEVAFAVRLENLYALLDSDGVHFRFNPGPLPERPEPSASSQLDDPSLHGQTPDAVFCKDLPIEGMLLEFARLSDDGERIGNTSFVTDDVVPTLCAPWDEKDGLARFYQECDGASTLTEIGDRLSWPIRQVRQVVTQQIEAGMLRLLDAHETLALAQEELLAGNNTRAGARLNAWCLQSWPGPPPPQEGDMLVNEWSAARLQNALGTMPQASARTLLRRLDLAVDNPLHSIRHWEEYTELFRRDQVAAIHHLVCQIRSDADPNTPSLKELLVVARSLREADHPARAVAFLRIAAARDLDTTTQSMEVGLGLVQVGAVDEGAPFVEEAAEVLIDNGQSAEAVGPLRTLVAANRSNRRARKLLARARTRLVRSSITHKHALIALSIVLALSCGAWVQIRLRRDHERLLDEAALLAERSAPGEALAFLEQHFSEDDSPRVERMREGLVAKKRSLEQAVRAEWTDTYTEAQLECTLGDPRLGLERALALPVPPLPADPRSPWPRVTDLFNSLAARLEGDLAKVGADIVDTSEQARDEESLLDLLAQLDAVLVEIERTKAVDEFRERLDDLEKRLVARRDQRIREREDRARTDNLALQDRLLATARSHAHAGDLSRALDVYERLLEADASGQIGRLLGREIGDLRSRHDAVVEARGFAAEGRHEQAREVLEEGIGSAVGWPLPWEVDTFPPGARARFADGTIRVAPFEVKSGFGEDISFVLEAPDYDPFEVRADAPQDRFVWLSRTPDARWHTTGRVDTQPVAVGEDHVSCDRDGRLVRLTSTGPAWTAELPSLGGVARAPVFLPRRAGHLLVITEDGEAWIVDAEDGSRDGPWAVGSPPVAGPVATQEGVIARFADGRVLRWDTRLVPTDVDADRSELELPRRGSDAGLSVLRRKDGGEPMLEAPWSNRRVEVRDEAFCVLEGDSDEPVFAVGRVGEWVWVAWEAPNTLAPHGRLWISDGDGLRSFQH